MRPEYVLYQYLTQVPDLVSLVGDRLFPPPRPETGPDSNLPAVVYQRVSPGPRFTAHGEPSTLGMPRIQFSCFASTEKTAWEVAEAIRTALDGWSSPLTSPRIDGVSCEEPIEHYEEDTKTFHVVLDVIVRYGR